jgi:tyrosine-protein kinase Etk/Wzc
LDSIDSKNDFLTNLIERLTILARYKKYVGGITVAVAVLSVVISLLLTPIYRAETKILPPQQGSSNLASQLMNQLGGLSALVASSIGVKTQNETFIGILRSRTVFDRIVDRFGLVKLYDVKYREDARRKLAKALRVTSDKDNMITVDVEDPDPKRAADMANAFVEELISVSKGLAITEAAQRRLFFEDQLKDTKAVLAKSEEEMRKFQEKTGALKIDDQARAVILGIGSLRAQIAAKEVQYKVARTYATSQNPALQRIEEELKGLKAELSKQERKDGYGPDPLMSTGRMPSVGIEYVRRLRDVKYQETLFELLAKQYELAKLDEARDAVVIQVIDKAVPPERKVRPKRAMIVLLSTITALLLSGYAVFCVERRREHLKSAASETPDAAGDDERA